MIQTTGKFISQLTTDAAFRQNTYTIQKYVYFCFHVIIQRKVYLNLGAGIGVKFEVFLGPLGRETLLP